MMKDLENQSEIVIRQLQLENGLSLEKATNTWYCSKTKEEVEKRDLYFISGMRCYWELMLELEKDSRWMRDSFE